MSATDELLPSNYVFDPSTDDLFSSDILDHTLQDLEFDFADTLDSLLAQLNELSRQEPVLQIPTPQETQLLLTVKNNGEVQMGLEKLWLIKEGLKEVQVLIDLKEYESCLTSIGQVGHKLETFINENWGSHETKPRIVRTLREYVKSKENEINQVILDTWKEMVIMKSDGLKCSLAFSSADSVELATLVDAVIRLDKILEILPPSKRVLAPKPQIENLLEFLEKNVFEPILHFNVEDVEVQDNMVSLKFKQQLVKDIDINIEPGSAALDGLLDSLSTVLEFLHTKLTEIPNIYNLILTRFSSYLVKGLTTAAFAKTLPLESLKLNEYKKHLVGVEVLETKMGEWGWNVSTELTTWCEIVDEEWERKAKVEALEHIRSQMIGYKPESFERVKYPGEKSNLDTKKVQKDPKEENRGGDEWDWNDDDADADIDADADAWDMDNDKLNLSDDENVSGKEADDWGWGDDDIDTNIDTKLSDSKLIPTTLASDSNEELCSVTSLPTKIAGIIKEFQATTSSKDTAIFLSLYRALSPVTYVQTVAIVAHNDLALLLSQLQPPASPPLPPLQPWQTELDRILAQANGFADSVENRFQCQAAIERTLNLFSSLDQELHDYACLAVRTQILGMLFEHLCTEIITAIERFTAISAEESEELAKLVAILLTIPDTFQGDLDTSYYTPSRVKMEYLGRILGSGLKEISEMFRDYKLVDFGNLELVGLIEALFAHSEYRTRMIDEIMSV